MGWKALSSWALSALWHSAVCYAVPTLALAGCGGEGSLLQNTLGLAGGGPHASSEGLWQTGTLGFTLVVVVVNLKLLVASRTHTVWHVLVVALSIAAYLGYLVLYSSLSPAGAVMSRIAPAAAVYGVAAELARNPAAWIALIVGTAACLLPDLALSSVRPRRQGKKGEGENEEEEGGGGAAVLSAANAKRSSSSSAVGGCNGGKLKAGVVGEAESSSSSSPSAVAGEISSPAPPPFPPVSSSRSPGRPPLHPLRSVSLQSRISELQRDVAGGNNDTNDGSNSTAAAALARRNSAALTSSSSSPSSASSSARHTGYAFDHPGFASFFADEAEREVRRTTSLRARVSGGGGGNGGGAAAALATSSADEVASVAASSAAATAGTSASGEASLSPLSLSPSPKTTTAMATKTERSSSRSRG